MNFVKDKFGRQRRPPESASQEGGGASRGAAFQGGGNVGRGAACLSDRQLVLDLTPALSQETDQHQPVPLKDSKQCNGF